MRIPRDELYRRVWETPISKVAKEFDISDVGLSKACRKAHIPTPPVGYWAKVAHGKAVQRPVLPKSVRQEVVLEAVRFRATEPRTHGDAPAIPVPSVTVRQEATELAPVAAATLAVLGNAKPDKDGFVRSGSSMVYSCELGALSVKRAALVLDAIERALPDAGVKLVRDRDSKRIEFEVEGERIAFSLTEDFKRTEHVKVDPKYDWRKERFFTYAFSGALRLVLHADCRGRRQWADGVRNKLEAKVGSFIVGLVEAARGVRALREERAEQKRKWEEQARLSQIAADRAQRLRLFKENFIAEATAWQRYQQVRAYLDHLQGQVAAAIPEAPAASAAWLAQAEVSVEELNPGKKRVQRLIGGYEPPQWASPFGDTLVAVSFGPR